jgi:hypothetical protein
VDLALFVVPFEVYANVSTSRPIGGDFVVFFEDFFEMLDVISTDVFDSEIIGDKSELNGSGLMFPESWDQLTLIVAMLVQTLFKEFIGKQSCLREAVHYFYYLNVDGTVFGDFVT